MGFCYDMPLYYPTGNGALDVLGLTRAWRPFMQPLTMLVAAVHLDAMPVPPCSVSISSYSSPCAQHLCRLHADWTCSRAGQPPHISRASMIAPGM